MLVRDISLYLETTEYDRDFCSDFMFRSRFVCHYLRRRVAAEKVRGEGFGSIAVRGCQEPPDGCPIRGERVAVPSVFFDRRKFDALPHEHRPEFFIEMLTDGLTKCARHHDLPLRMMVGALMDFREGGYRDDWTHKKKLLRGSGLRAALLCRMDTDSFKLRLQLSRQAEVVFDEQILETKPDEVIFACQFKDIVLLDDIVTVVGRGEKPFFEVALSNLA